MEFCERKAVFFVLEAKNALKFATYFDEKVSSNDSISITFKSYNFGQKSKS